MRVKLVNDSLNNFTKEIITKTVRLRLLKINVSHYTYLPGTEIIEIEHLANQSALLDIIGKDKKYPLIIDSTNIVLLTPEVRKLIRSLESLIPISRRAIVIKTHSQRIVSSFYIKFHKPIVPKKFFTNYDEAYDWLIKFN